jgi:hypothetical protein
MSTNSAELLHAPDSDPLWQESCFFVWHDPKAGIAGVHRLGLQVGRNSAVSCCLIMTDEGTHYRYNELNESLTHGGVGANMMAAGPQSVAMGTVPVISFNSKEVQLKISVQDLHTLTQALEGDDGGYQETLLASNHAEGFARFAGEVTIDGRSYKINGKGFRDHSWGPRDWNALLNFRTCIGCTGPDLAWSALVMHIKGKPVMTKGYVERNGKSVMARKIDLVCFLEGDGISHRGGTCRMELEDDTSLYIELDTVLGSILCSPNVYNIEGICKVRIDGKEEPDAFCDLEMGNNARDGKSAPEYAMRASLAPGLSRFKVPG